MQTDVQKSYLTCRFRGDVTYDFLQLNTVDFIRYSVNVIDFFFQNPVCCPHRQLLNHDGHASDVKTVSSKIPSLLYIRQSCLYQVYICKYIALLE